jgi:hypothetical protein
MQTSRAELERAERDLLRLKMSPDAPALDVLDVPVGPGREERLHAVRAGDKSKPPMVLMHGYGAGLGFYYRNMDFLARNFNVHAVDWLGWGGSGRPSDPLMIKVKVTLCYQCIIYIIPSLVYRGKQELPYLYIYIHF